MKRQIVKIIDKFLAFFIFSVQRYLYISATLIDTQYKYSALTEKIIGCAMMVHRKLKNGLPEIFYQKALLIELHDTGLQCMNEVQIPVFYKGIDIGNRYADIIVEKKIILELKAVSQLEDIHLAQALNYLEITQYEIGLLLNFGSSSLQIRRLINQFKTNQ